MDKSYPHKVLTLGDAIRKRRMDLSLRQKDVAEIIRCDQDTITNWENGRRSPTISHTAKIAEFLEYNPFPEGTNLAERLVNYRKTRGLPQKELARQLAIDSSTLARTDNWDIARSRGRESDQGGHPCHGRPQYIRREGKAKASEVGYTGFAPSLDRVDSPLEPHPADRNLP